MISYSSSDVYTFIFLGLLFCIIGYIRNDKLEFKLGFAAVLAGLLIAFVLK